MNKTLILLALVAFFATVYAGNLFFGGYGGYGSGFGYGGYGRGYGATYYRSPVYVTRSYGYGGYGRGYGGYGYGW